jgi:hypothetical protein
MVQLDAGIREPSQTPHSHPLEPPGGQGEPLSNQSCSLARSNKRRIQETLNARSEYTNSEDDGAAQHRLNQYIIKQEIGRGSFGAVHLAVDQYGTEYVRSLAPPLSFHTS